MIAIIPLLAAIVGLLIYVLAANAKVVEVGRALFWCGLLVTLFTVASKVIKVF
jgi:hypothetical protein